MVQPFDKLAEIMRRRAEEVVSGTSTLMKRVALSIDRDVIFDTPVDTGAARSNWITTLNTPSSVKIPPYAPGDRLGRGETANATAAIAQANVAIRPFDVLRNRSIHITNNVGYIQSLNDGSSAQAPAMFVQKAIQRAVSGIKGIKVFKDFKGS